MFSVRSTAQSDSAGRPSWWFAVMAAFAVVLAACGSGDETATDQPLQTTASTTETDEDHDEDEDHEDEDHDESAGLGAHEHGTAELSVAWIGADVVVDLISPTQNVFGFEYEPETDEDVAVEAERTAAITADGIVTINDGATCELTEPATTEIEREGSHSEITVSWTFSCDNPADIAEVDLTALFEEFPGFEDIDAEWVSDTDQSSAELSPGQGTLQLVS